MSAPQQLLLAGRAPVKYTTTLTRGTGTATGPPFITFTGFDNASGPLFTPDAIPVGSLAATTFFNGLTCKNYYTDDFSNIFVVTLAGNQPQSTVFKAVNSTGTYLTSSGCTYNFDGTNSHWRWAKSGTFSGSGTETIELWG